MGNLFTIRKRFFKGSDFIYITDVNGGAQLNVYSPHIASLIIRVCTEIEAISKELYFHIKGEKKRGDKSIKFDEDCLKLIDIKYNTSRKNVQIISSLFNITKGDIKIFKPLKEAHKSGGRDWEKAYQAFKT